MDDLFEINMALRYRIRDLENKIGEFKSGARYIKLQKDHHRVTAGYIKEISRLRKELGDARAQVVNVRNIWTEECYDLFDEYRTELRKKEETIRKLEEKIWDIQRKSDEKLARVIAEYDEKAEEKDHIISELKNKLAHAEALLGRDSTNTGMPTSQTPPDKEKRIPNTRVKTGKPKGGQKGHEKHSLEKPEESEVTDIVPHYLNDDDCCPKCYSENYTLTGRSEAKYEYDVRVKVVRVRHVFYEYRCDDCGTLFRSVIPPDLKEEAQYGSNIQALALSLTNTVNASMNKVSMFLNGITNGELAPCEGYVAKLQKRGAGGLRGFREDLKRLLITRSVVYWDDTVIMILKERACFRFYGDEAIAYYTAHAHKDMESIDDDNVLALLTSETKTMHDHNTVNYNRKFCFGNIECNQHLQRDCQKNTDNTVHKWSADMKEFIGKTIKERTESINRGEKSFDEEYIKIFNEKIDGYLSDGWEENEGEADNYGASFERTLLRRIEKYRKNYFMWVEDFSLPTTNNLSERGLRGVKSHMKISGQFESEAAADNYALIRTYIETCRRNGINEIDALKRLCSGNPYSVEEIFFRHS